MPTDDQTAVAEAKLQPGTRVTVFSDIDRDEGGFAATIEYEGTVVEHPRANMLVMDDGTGIQHVRQLIERAPAFQVLHE